jgi:hypothetical protein
MQRRHAALYAALLLILAAGSYATIGTVESPVITISNPDYSYDVGGEILLNDRIYKVTSLMGNFAELEWIDVSATKKEQWDLNDAIQIDISNEPIEFIVSSISIDPPTPTFHLTEVRSLEGVPTVQVGSETYVVLNESNSNGIYPIGSAQDNPVLIPKEDYLMSKFGPQISNEFTIGSVIQYNSNSVSVIDISEQEVTVSWSYPKSNTMAISEGDILESNETNYIAHFKNNLLHLSSDISGYEKQAMVIKKFNERLNGLWGVSILGSIGAIILISMAYLPSRY